MSENIDPILKPITDASHEFGEPMVLHEEIIKEHEKIRAQLQKEAEQFPFLKDDENALELNRILREMNSELLRFRDELEHTPIKAALYNWLIPLHDETRRQYSKFILFFFDNNIIHAQFADGKEFTIGGFRHVNHSASINFIHSYPNLENENKEAMSQCYAAFVSYLDHISYGWFKRALWMITKKENAITRQGSFTLGDWRTFIDVLDAIDQRDSIISRCLMAGTASLNEVLNLKIEQIDWQKNCIRFFRTKRLGIIKEITVTYPAYFIHELKEYIESTTQRRKNSCLVFITRNGKRVTRSRLNYSLAAASSKADLQKVSPDKLKKIWSTLKQEGVSETAIIRSKKWKLYDKNDLTMPISAMLKNSGAEKSSSSLNPVIMGVTPIDVIPS